jgi:hypothetical protein
MYPSPQTILIISTFALCYLYFTMRKTARQQLDIYDLAMLSTVAFVPAGFVLFPAFSDWVAKISGVAFPFVVMFGLLFVILFFFIHRLTVKLHRLEHDNRLLVQEVSIIKFEIMRGPRPTGERPNEIRREK